MSSGRLPSWILALACCLALASATGGTAGAKEKTVLLGGDDTEAEAEAAPPRRRRMVTELDEKRAGEQGAKAVAAQMGVLSDPEINAYVQRIGDRLLKAVPRRPFEFHFGVVDQDGPNAFALPGGYIFISRGLLAVAETEDELANVIGHEIGHVTRRHSVRQQAIQQQTNKLIMGYMREARMRSYGRDMEREADEIGQKLAAAAGYDPMGMSTFMETLGDWEQLATGRRRQATWFDSHPTSSERAAVNAIRVSELRWQRDKSLGDTRTSHLRSIDGIPVGQRPQSGVFEGDRFLHPDLDFQLRFPKGWRASNTNAAVGAQSRNGSVVFLSADVPQEKPIVASERFLKKNPELKVRKTGPDMIRGSQVWRVDAQVSRANVDLVFFTHKKNTWLLVGSWPGFLPSEQKLIQSTIRSFQPLTPDQRSSIRETLLRIEKARPGEGLLELSKRTGNAWDQGHTAVANGVPWGHRFAGGELVKVVDSEPYHSPGR